MRDKIISISSSNGRDFIRYGFIGLLDELVHRLNPSAREKLLIIKTIELYLNYDAPKGDLREGERQYMESVDKLMSFLYPSNFEDRLTQALGRDYWEYTKEFRESSGEGVKEDDIIQIASEFIKTPELFHKYRHLLFSNEAKAAGIIGKKLGEMDREGVFLTMIFSVVKEYTNLSFLTGYIASLSEKHPEMIPRINTELDNLEVKEPIISYNIFRSVPLISNALQRCLDLVKAKKLQAHYLGFIYYSELFEKMSNQDLVEVLTTIRDYMQGDEENSEEAAIHICSKAATKKFRQNVLDTPELLKLIWYFLERTA